MDTDRDRSLTRRGIPSLTAAMHFINFRHVNDNDKGGKREVGEENNGRTNANQAKQALRKLAAETENSRMLAISQ